MKRMLLILLLVPFVLVQGQKKEDHISVHANIFSVVFPTGFDEGKERPGNLLIGGQYNYFLNDDFSIIGGLNLTWLEMNGRNKNIVTNKLLWNTQFEVLALYFFLGANLDVGGTDIFLKIGASIFGKQNQLGTYKGWVLEGESYTLIPLEIGAKWNLNDNWGIISSIMGNFGDKISIDPAYYPGSVKKDIDFLSFNVGISYAFVPEHNEFQSKIDGLNHIITSIKEDKFKSDSDYQSQILNLNLKVEKMENDLENCKENDTPQLTINEINEKYNLKLGQEQSLDDFFDNNELSEIGDAIISEYDQAANELNVKFVMEYPARFNEAMNRIENKYTNISFTADEGMKNVLFKKENKTN